MSTMNSKVIWIVNHYSTLPLKDGAGNRHFMIARGLENEGWSSRLFLASTKHPSGDQFLKQKNKRYSGVDQGIPFTMLGTRPYKSSFARLWNMIEFSFRLQLPSSTRGIESPDVVMGCTVHLLAAWSALRLARRFNVPFVFEVRDLWPETLIDLGKLNGKGIPARLMSMLSKHLYRNADLVVSPLPGVRRHLDDLGFGDKPFCWVSNGILDDPSEPVPRDSDDNKFTFMYMGSHGNANGLRGLLEAFDVAATESFGAKELSLRLIGDGPLKPELQAFTQTLRSSSNIVFQDRIDRSEVIETAREADALVVNIEDLPVYRFGISLNKIFDYMAAARPIVIATNAMNNPVADAGAGISVPAGNKGALVNALREMSALETVEREEMATRALEHVKNYYSVGPLAKRFAKSLELMLVEDGSAKNRGGSMCRFGERMKKVVQKGVWWNE